MGLYGEYRFWTHEEVHENKSAKIKAAEENKKAAEAHKNEIVNIERNLDIAISILRKAKSSLKPSGVNPADISSTHKLVKEALEHLITEIYLHP